MIGQIGNKTTHQGLTLDKWWKPYIVRRDHYFVMGNIWKTSKFITFHLFYYLILYGLCILLIQSSKSLMKHSYYYLASRW